MFITQKKARELTEKAIKAQKYQQKHTENQRDRAVDACVALGKEVARIREENEALTELVESLRWRIFMLLRSTDVDAEVFGLPKYALAEVPEVAHDEDLPAPDWREAYNELQVKYRTEG